MEIEPIEINGDLVLSLAATVSSMLNTDLFFKDYIDIKNPDILQKCVKANRKTILHDYIETVCSGQLSYIMLKHFDKEAADKMKLWMDSLGISYSDIVSVDEKKENDIERYADDIQELFNEKALPIISNAVFAILFQDKDFCYKFNYKLAEQIRKLKKKDYPDILQADGYLNREYFPTWAKEGVFYRDKGRCQLCGTDLTKIFVLANTTNYDHIIPLKLGGNNDPTNYQLTCEECNKSKNARSCRYRNLIWPMWSDEN